MMPAAARAATMAEQLELFVRMIAAPLAKKKSVSSEAITTAASATDISFADLAEWEAMEIELEKEHDSVIDSDVQPNRMCDEGKQLDEELDSLRGQLKGEKAYDHRENLAHQQRVKRLQQMLQKVKREDASRRKAWEAKVDQIEKQLQKEKEDLRRKLQQARCLNERLQEMLDAPANLESKDTGKSLKAELCTLRLALSEEGSKARLLGQELEEQFANQRSCNIEAKKTENALDILNKQLVCSKTAARLRARKVHGMNRRHDETRKALHDAKEVVRALRCKEIVAKAKLQDMQGVPRATTTITSRVASPKAEQHPLLLLARRLALGALHVQAEFAA